VSDLNRTRAPNCTCKWAICKCPVEFIVYYAQNNFEEWIIERTSDGAEIRRGSLERMMDLINHNPEFASSRRAHHAEDMLRWRPRILDVVNTYGAKCICGEGDREPSLPHKTWCTLAE
jgi:hypothetical protein